MKPVLPVIAAALVLSATSAAGAAVVRVVVKPGTVSPGATITVSALSSPCPPRDQIILISTAFAGHAYGKGAVYGTVRAHGAFAVRARVRAGLARGRYQIGFRCGGGNLGVSAYVRVR